MEKAEAAPGRDPQRSRKPAAPRKADPGQEPEAARLARHSSFKPNSTAAAAAPAASKAGPAPAEPLVAVSRMDKNFVGKSMADGLAMVYDTWDYAGQRVFYALFHLFLTS